MAYGALATVAHKDPVETDWGNAVGANNAAFKTFCVGASDLGTSAHTHTGTTDGAALGTDTVGQTQISAGAVHQGELDTSTNEVSLTKATVGTAASQLTPTNTSYSFMPQFKVEEANGYDCAIACGFCNYDSSGPAQLIAYDGGKAVLGTTYKLNLSALIEYDGASSTIYGQIRYVNSSPPYRWLGCDDAGLFLFLLRDAATGAIESASIAPDPVWGSDNDWRHQDDPARIIDVPHPWPVCAASGIPDGHEIVMVDLREWQQYAQQPPSRAELMLAHVRDQRQVRLDAGISEDAQAALEARLEADVQYEHARRGQRSRIVDAVEESYARRMAEMPASAAPAVAARRAHALRVARRAAGQRTRWEALDEALRAVGSSLMALIMSGAGSGVADAAGFLDAVRSATSEVAKHDRDALPTVLVGPGRQPWRNVVHVLQPGRGA